VRGNQIHDNASPGVYVYDQGMGVLLDNDITGNSQGVTTTTGGSPTARGNKLHANKQPGIFAYDKGLGLFEDNDITGNGVDGVAISKGGNPTLRGNRIYANEGRGVMVYDEGLGLVQENDIHGNTQAGITIKTGGNPAVHGNTIRGNAGSAFRIYDNGRGTITGNTLEGNTQGAWNISSECEPNVIRQDNDTTRQAAAKQNRVIRIPSDTGFVEGEPVQPRTPEVESLIDELVDIGNGRGFMTVKSNDKRTREIGERLNKIGGKRLMQQVHWEVSGQVRRSSRELDVAWDRIGDWLG
jgi:parallel beta-helix repeat protein